MNISTLVTRMKIELGLYSLALPFDNLDQAIMDVIQTITVRTFSTYCPYRETYRFDLTDLTGVEKHANWETYLLPDIFANHEITQIVDVKYDEADISGIGYWGGGIPLLHGNMMNQSILSNAGLALTRQTVPKLLFKYEPPRKVTLYNVLCSSQLVFDIAMIHDKNLTTITPTMEESFHDLAILDVKDMLYQTMKHYNEIQTAYGTIQMKLDDWQNAADQRKQLVDDWANLYQMDIIPFTYG